MFRTTQIKRWTYQVELVFSVCVPKISDSLWEKKMLQYIVSLEQSVPAH